MILGGGCNLAGYYRHVQNETRKDRKAAWQTTFMNSTRNVLRPARNLYNPCEQRFLGDPVSLVSYCMTCSAHWELERDLKAVGQLI